MEKKSYLQIYFTKRQKDFLKRKAVEKGLSMGAILKNYIEREIKKEEKILGRKS